jgi:GntR family transcriptional regulator
MLPFTIQLTTGEPAYEQILSAVRKALYSGQLRDGDSFPSVRALSQELRISPTTAHKVVSMLKSEGLLAARPGIGMVVTAAELPGISERQAMIAESAYKLARDAQDLSLDLAQTIEILTAQWREAQGGN